MSTSSSLHSDNPLRPRKKLSFGLPSFRKPSAAADGETNAEEVARVRKAAAWQWYTRGVGEVVAPTRASRPRPAVAPGSSTPPEVQLKLGHKSRSGEVINNSDDKQQQRQIKPQLPDQPQAARPVSRFKAEAASAPRQATTSAARAASGSPLYDEFELSGLRTHMAGFVQRLQKQQKAQDALQAAASVGDQKSTAPSSTGAAEGLASAAASTTAFHRRLSALHRFFRRVISGPILKNATNSPTAVTTPAVQEPFPRPLDEKEDSLQHHYHHYIHHHHHHYHYGDSSEDGASALRHLQRRHSESSGIRPQIPSPWEEIDEEYGEEVEENPIKAYLARRRRHSDSFADHNFPQKAVSDAGEEGDHPVKPVLALQLPRRYNSERFVSTTPNKIPVEEHVSKGSIKGDEIDEGVMQSTDIRSRRRYSAEILREGGATLIGRGKTEGGTYKLGGAPAGAAPAYTKVVARRRHSEALDASFRREILKDHMGMRGNRTPSPASSGSMKVPMTPPSHLPASRRHHLDDMYERQASLPASVDHRRPPLSHAHWELMSF